MVVWQVGDLIEKLRMVNPPVRRGISEGIELSLNGE